MRTLSRVESTVRALERSQSLMTYGSTLRRTRQQHGYPKSQFLLKLSKRIVEGGTKLVAHRFKIKKKIFLQNIGCSPFINELLCDSIK